ncbi:hypothetical protein COT98_02290 [Candidatus Falkowbacteria bacterium CG10_big_fil_rev_8_21_14_0_10_39_9]|uniref:Uncharacterized protein n=1 Tax=Candidatus Falkowbacteria bacterium CG10_big_fil_rev_8_21_14_0_10_39_9 TaxID=1974566 RepID=A0A2M6WPP2_9BACT|nr:MAG: hypothetical protein COT98_02290 [Candidatus Falkowbacteria bacterium CG10_big_fil_rev_8_21_14_0_10_39_9]
MRKVLLILAILTVTIYSCQKYEIVKQVVPPPPPKPFVPDQSWIGEGPFFVKVEADSLKFLFCNDYVVGPSGVAFFEYKIGDSPYYNRITQVVLLDHSNWGSGSILTALIIPANSLISIQFGVGSVYANVAKSRFNNSGIIEFSLITIR